MSNPILLQMRKVATMLKRTTISWSLWLSLLITAFGFPGWKMTEACTGPEYRFGGQMSGQTNWLAASRVSAGQSSKSGTPDKTQQPKKVEADSYSKGEVGSNAERFAIANKKKQRAMSLIEEVL